MLQYIKFISEDVSSLLLIVVCIQLITLNAYTTQDMEH